MLGLVRQALPEKYMEDDWFNRAFGWHIYAHYRKEAGIPPAGGGILKRFIIKNLSAMDEEAYNELCEEMEGLIAIRKHNDMMIVAGISTQTGIKHRSIVTGLKKMKPHMVKEAIEQIRSQSVNQMNMKDVKELEF